jgi:hypothetical protein
VSLMFVDRWRRDDLEVNERLAEAERVGAQGLISEATRRAVRGIEEDIYYKGEVVGQKTLYSDGLLSKLLEANIPKFSKSQDAANVNVNVNVANIMPRATNYDEWLEMKRATIEKPAVRLPTPVEAEYVDLETLVFEGIEL